MLGRTFGAVLIFSATVTAEFLVLTQNGPAVFGATVTVRAEVYDDQTNQSITSPCNYGFFFTDDDEPPNQLFDFSQSCSSEWSITYQPKDTHKMLVAGDAYNISVIGYIKRGMRFWPITRANTVIQMTPFLNGEIDILQHGAAVPYYAPVFLHSKFTARVELSPPDAKLLNRLGASFKTDWSFEVEVPCNSCERPSSVRNMLLMDRAWSLAKNAHPGSSFTLKLTSFHGSYIEVRARLCAVVRNNTDLTSLGNTYGFFYRRFQLLDPMAASSLSNFTVESNLELGHIVVHSGEIDAVIIEQ